MQVLLGLLLADIPILAPVPGGVCNIAIVGAVGGHVLLFATCLGSHARQRNLHGRSTISLRLLVWGGAVGRRWLILKRRRHPRGVVVIGVVSKVAVVRGCCGADIVGLFFRCRWILVAAVAACSLLLLWLRL